jgi:hypothetical protein
VRPVVACGWIHKSKPVLDDGGCLLDTYTYM